MSKTNIESSVKMTDMLLSALKIRPMYRREMVNELNLSHADVNNCITRLKREGLVKMIDEDAKKHPNNRRWGAISKESNYRACIIAKRGEKAITDAPMTRKVEFSPMANRAMCITADNYHVRGKYEKVSAWTGYESMGGL